jgi:hypothetical protein
MAEQFVENLQKTHEELCIHLERAKKTYKRNTDRKRDSMPVFKVGDQVWLNRTNIVMERPSRKLDIRKLGPFRISEIVGESKQTF